MFRNPYGQSRRKLVLAFDIGTTYSGISYSILDPGQVPDVKGVTRFPANEQISGASKIPTVIYYDQEGNVRAVGAEAMRDGIIEDARDEEWVKAEWFKLHLRSQASNETKQAQAIVPLPPNKTVVELFADFLRYLFTCAAQYIRETHSGTMWSSIKDNIDFVLSHPNGWEGREQREYRKAAVMAGLIPDTPAGQDRISFVTEGEASLHYAIQRGILSISMQTGDGVIVVDAGGGTIDVSAYRCDPKLKTFEEIAAPQCHFHGSVFVSVHLRAYLQGFLEDSPFFDDIDHIVNCFDKSTKPRFKNDKDPQYIKFGSTRDNDPEFGIRFGQMKMDGSDIAKFFQPSVDCIVKAVLEQREASEHDIGHVVLVGGFAASDWLLNSVRAALANTGLAVFRPEDHINKAVSDGAVSFYVDHFVRIRVSKYAFGTLASASYNSKEPDHALRTAKAIQDIDGRRLLPNHFYMMIPKNTQISETKEFRKNFSMMGFDPSHFQMVSNPIWCYRGNGTCPKWKDVDPENFVEFCHVEADLSRIPLVPENNEGGHVFYRVHFDIILLFGLTEIQAQMAWMENDVERRGPATIMYTRDV